MVVLFGRQSLYKASHFLAIDISFTGPARLPEVCIELVVKRENGQAILDAPMTPSISPRITNTREKPSGHLEVTVIDCVALHRSIQDTKAQGRQ